MSSRSPALRESHVELVGLPELLSSYPVEFREPEWAKDEQIQKVVQHNLLLDRGYLKSGVFTILLKEATRDMFSLYELVNIFQLPCVKESLVTSLSISGLAATASWISSRMYIKSLLRDFLLLMIYLSIK